jgi:hypothetical protein
MLNNGPWTPAENEVLRAAIANKLRLRDVARQLNRSEAATDHRMRRLGVKSKLIIVLWTHAEDDELRARRRNNEAMAEIAKAMGRTECSVKARCRRLGIGQVFTPKQKNRPALSSAPNDGAAVELRNLMIANIMHLLDLKRAGHSPSRTELDIPQGYGAPRLAPAPITMSITGSSAAQCAIG